MLEQELIINKSMDSQDIKDLSNLASGFDSCNITLEFGSRTVNVKSLMGLISLGLKIGNKIKIVVCGDDESKTMEKIKNFLQE